LQSSFLFQHRLGGEQPCGSLEHRREELNALLKEQWEFVIEDEPRVRDDHRDKRYNDKMSEVSEKRDLFRT